VSAALVQSDHVRRILAARGPFASVYFDDSHDATDSARRLDVKCGDIVRELESLGAGAALVSAVERAVLGARPPAGPSGRGLIVTADWTVVGEQLPAPPAHSVVRVSELPYLVPLVDYWSTPTTYLVVAIDHLGADLSTFLGDRTCTETVEAGAYPVHAAGSAENYGFGAQQHRVEEAIRRNVRAVADAVTESYDRDAPEIVFVIGDDRVRAELASMLPERVAARLVRPRVGARHTGLDETVRQAMNLEFENRRRDVVEDATSRFRAESGRRSGLAAEGLTDVCAALREGAVATLILGDLGDETVVAADEPALVATDADALSEFGAAPTRILRADEAVPYAALIGGAELVHDESIDLRDGVAAVLRFAVAPLDTRTEGRR
jgi:peptide chain release factor subunit 1